MRIAYFTSIYPRATDTFIQREVAGLRQRGHEVITLSTNKPGSAHLISPELKDIFNNTVYLLPFNPLLLAVLNLKGLVFNTRRYLHALKVAFKTARPGLKGFIYQLFYFQESLLLAKQLQQHAVQHIHNHFGDSSGSITMLASLHTGIEYSITFHGPHIFFEPTLLALREKVKFAKFIACISQYCKSQMMLFSDPEDWHKLEIVHCGIDMNNYTISTRQVDVAAGQPLKLLYVGRLAAEKGVPVLLRSLIALKNEGYAFQLTLLGDGAERAALEAEVKEHGLDQMVHFGGFASQETVKSTLQASDVFVLPSFAEGVPVSLMEAMACGVPVIGTNVGGVTELIEHGVSGLVVAPSDEVALKNAISKYSDNPALRESVKLAARQVVEKSFNLENEVSKLDQYISKAQKG